jgi:cytochrome c-type biogenesis protein CcmE
MRHSLVIIAAVLPLAINSAYLEFIVAQSDLRYSLTPPDTTHAETYNRVRLRVTGLDEWAGLATMQVSGVHICDVSAGLLRRNTV